MRKFQKSTSSPARWLVATATLGCLTAFASQKLGSETVLYAQ
ncbi:MAG: hypothetical protein RIS76_4045, partial [Verrucomicrobiota bacterium]